MKNKTEVTIKLPNGSELTEKQAREVYAKLDELFGKPTTVTFKEPNIGPGIWPNINPLRPYYSTPEVEPFPTITCGGTSGDTPIYASQ